jgi:ribosomal protein L11 methyltransferase
MEWMELTIDTTTEGCDLVANVLYEAGVAGVVIEDPEDARDLMRQKGEWDYIEAGALNTKGDVVVVKGYLPADDSLDRRLDMVKMGLDGMTRGYVSLGTLQFSTDSVEDEEWAESWKKFYKPLRIGQNIVVKPPWEHYQPGERDIIVTIDPGVAFGTGTHESTALCMELMEKNISKGDRVLDIGCGSGILAVTAALLGARTVEAYDNQQLAVDITQKNAGLNGVGHIVKAERGDLLERVKGRADLIVSNIVADVIIRMGPLVAGHLKPGAAFIVSGIIRDRKEEVCKALLYNGMEIMEERRRNEWVALTARTGGWRY